MSVICLLSRAAKLRPAPVPINQKTTFVQRVRRKVAVWPYVLRAPSCAGFFGPYTICYVGYIICTLIYFVSCTLDLCGPCVASEMTNSKLVPKNTKISKKAKIWIILAFWQIWLFWFFLVFLKNLAFLANFGFFGQFGLYFGFFGKIWISCSLHRGYI
jgi:hypothetical protein